MQVGNIGTPSSYFKSLEINRLQALPRGFTTEGDHTANAEGS